MPVSQIDHDKLNTPTSKMMISASPEPHNYKQALLNKVCYTALMYSRIRKKLDIDLPDERIEALITKTISEADEGDFIRKGKNIYVTHTQMNIILTINSYTYTIITAGLVKKTKIRL